MSHICYFDNYILMYLIFLLILFSEAGSIGVIREPKGSLAQHNFYRKLKIL